MNYRVNWGAIFAGAVSGLGVLLVLGEILNGVFVLSKPPRLLGQIPSTGAEAIFAVLVALIGFGFVGAGTTLFGRFPRFQTAILHSLAALSVSYLTSHFLFRNAFFLGRPGLPFDYGYVPQNLAATGQAVLGPTLMTTWTVCISSVLGIAACLYGCYRAQRTVALGLALDEAERLTRAA